MSLLASREEGKTAFTVVAKQWRTVRRKTKRRPRAPTVSGCKHWGTAVQSQAKEPDVKKDRKKREKFGSFLLGHSTTSHGLQVTRNL